MQQRNREPSITWAQFEICNLNHQVAFENMCRILFNSFFFDGKALPHANPNNPGVEVQPMLHQESGKRISFQAKYFSTIDYQQIRHSAEMAIKHYSGELDVIYLYCNKDVTTTAQAYQNIFDLLGASGIEFIPITNQIILDQAMGNDTVAWYFFETHNLNESWFRKHIDESLSALGPRYNTNFNVSTHSEENLNLFLRNERAAAKINYRKENAVTELREKRWRYSKYESLWAGICNAIESLEDVAPESILGCLSWPIILSEKCADEIAKIEGLVEEKSKAYDEALETGNSDEISRFYEDIRVLQELEAYIEKATLNAYESNILQQKVLVVLGDAGAGKSQLFANASDTGMKSGIPSILLLGHTLLTNDPISVQIPAQLQLDLNMSALLQKLEGAGRQCGKQICIFIDAINETGYKQIWKTGLSGLINQINDLSYVRLAVSVRSGYENLVFDETIQNRISNREIAEITHTGFREESVQATREFLNYYGIPFLPSYFLQTEMTNPLFLKMFCENYCGEEVDLFTLFDHLIKKSDKEAQQAAGLDYLTDLLKYLVEQIAEIRLKEGWLSLSKEALYNLPFWNTYGLQQAKVPYVVSLERSGMLITSVYKGEERYSISYNLLEDFVCAKQLLSKGLTKEELIDYFRNDLLEIKEGEIKKYENQDIFIVACGLFAEKFGEECINSIAECITNEYHRGELAERYIMSFRWRKANAIDGESFLQKARSLEVRSDVLLRVLIECSTKKEHPLNANMLHEVLLRMPLTHRDYVWTIYINDLATEDERLFQLIEQFECGELLDGMSEDNKYLLLILFAWLLTSTNRRLRDKASKAAVELLKKNFSLCPPLLQMFETVNDPYVIQRLYGIVFGACIKREKEDCSVFRILTNYVYQWVFHQESVYPDVLLRDYARLIVQRWIHEFPDDCEFIDQTLIQPPYRSALIPTVERQDYYESGRDYSGFNAIDSSMRVDLKDCPGMYGDFGRYRFQSALSVFKDVNIVDMYHYAMQFIRDELGYTDELFGRYDTSSRLYSYNRHENRKVERIGKKYQWIALHNILARLSDSHLVSRWQEEPVKYEGPWEPYVRDFDPTLNRHFLRSDKLPEFTYAKSDENVFLEIDPFPSESAIVEWKKDCPVLFSSLNSQLMFSDKDERSWVTLYLFGEMKSKHHAMERDSIGISKGSQEVWHMEHGLFMKRAEFEENKEVLMKINYTGRHFPEGTDVYQLFNREYAWSPSIESILGSYWVEHEIEVGEKRKEIRLSEMPRLIEDDNGEITIELRETEYEVEVPERVVSIRVLPAYSRVLWEAEYDASQDETTAFDVPCKQLINCLKLEQREYDGYFYSPDGELVCFDSDLPGLCRGLLIRKEYLDQFLAENELVLFWTAVGEKQFFLGNYSQEWSEWSGMFYYANNQVIGQMECKNSDAG